MLSAITAPENQTRNKQGDTPSQLLVVDVNQHTREGKTDASFREWFGYYGMWKLSSPKKPTHKEGSALDKFLTHPGANAPEDCLPPDSGGWQGSAEYGMRGGHCHDEIPHFPSHTYSVPVPIITLCCYTWRAVGRIPSRRYAQCIYNSWIQDTGRRKRYDKRTLRS